MASLFEKRGKLWIRYKHPDGKWKAKPTNWNANHARDRREAERLVAKQSRAEQERRFLTSGASWDWVPGWIVTNWSGQSLRRYQVAWKHISEWLSRNGLEGPGSVRRAELERYIPDRMKATVGRNTASYELKYLRRVLGEAVQREYILNNPATGLRVRLEPRKEKRPWTAEELATVDADLKAREPHGWLRVTFLLGRYQAARLGSSALPLTSIDLAAKVIHWPREVMKHAKPLTQPIDARLLPELAEFVEQRRAGGYATLCDPPKMPSLEWRRYLDGLGLRGLVHHGLRVTWITSAAVAGIPQSVAQRFVGHSSATVHAVYLRFSTGDVASMLERLR
jgi:hypothetical protein